MFLLSNVVMLIILSETISDFIHQAASKARPWFQLAHYIGAYRIRSFHDLTRVYDTILVLSHVVRCPGLFGIHIVLGSSSWLVEPTAINPPRWVYVLGDKVQWQGSNTVIYYIVSLWSSPRCRLQPDR
jgi:hypothetical protein